MAGTGRPFDSLRSNRFENERLIFALLLSLAAHAIAFGGYELGREFQLFSWLDHAAKIQPVPMPVQNFKQPLEFVMVDRPSTEAPENAKYYSSQNSRAANPDATWDTDTPKVNGTQTDMPKTEDALRQQISKSQPSPESQQSAKSQQEPTPTIQPGDLTLLKLENVLTQKKPEPERIRKLSQVPGVKMKQDGGVRQRAVVPSFDVKLTGFGEYDAKLVEAIRQRWYDLLDSQQFALDRSGKVVLQFKLNYDGTVTDMKVAQNNVGELLGYVCQKAVHDPAPFAKWPSDMRFKLGDSREIQFTFFYY